MAKLCVFVMMIVVCVSFAKVMGFENFCHLAGIVSFITIVMRSLIDG